MRSSVKRRAIVTRDRDDGVTSPARDARDRVQALFVPTSTGW